MLNLNNVVFTTSTGFGCIFEKLILENKLHIDGSIMPDAMYSNELMSFSYAFLNEQLIGWCCFQYNNNHFLKTIMENIQYDPNELEFLNELKTNTVMQIQQQPYFLGTIGIFVKPEYRNMWIANELMITCKSTILPHLNKYMELKRNNYNYKFYIDAEPHILKFTERYFNKVCKIVSRR